MTDMGLTEKTDNRDYSKKEMPRTISKTPPQKTEKLSIPSAPKTPPPNKSSDGNKG